MSIYWSHWGVLPRSWFVSICVVCYRKIHLHIPKFSISGTYDVKNIVKEMGIVNLFTEQADLSGITGEPGLMVSKVSWHVKATTGFASSQEPDINIPWKAYPSLSEASLRCCQSGGKESSVFHKPEAKHAYKRLERHGWRARMKTYI